MSAPRIAVLGGGLAGIRAALSCADAGARVQLFEARGQLGGATWSTRLGGLPVDNGQHVFLRCCHAYRELLERLGVGDRVFLQPRLEVPVVAPGGVTAWLRRDRLPAPLHLARSLLGFAHLPFSERLRIARTARRLAALDLGDPELDARSFGSWLATQGESARAIEVFWDLIARPTLNLPAGEASLALATKVFQTGLLEAPDAGDIGWARVPLTSLHGEPAAHAMARAGVELRLRQRVTSLAKGRGGSFELRLGEARVAADAVIVALPHAAAAELLPSGSGVKTEALGGLGASPIVNLHVVLDRPVTDHPFVAAVDSPLQWIFDRSASAGLERGHQYLAISLSAADECVGLSRAALRRRFEPALRRLFPLARTARIVSFFSTCERRATFRQAPGSGALRPGPATRLPGLALAGAWTDTGWPDTMEGAVRSGLAAARVVLDASLGSQGRPARAA